MYNRELCGKIVDKLFEAENKFSEIESLVKMIRVWAKDRDHELFPVIEILNKKVASAAEILRKL